jgi:hypothetical protein
MRMSSAHTVPQAPVIRKAIAGVQLLLLMLTVQLKAKAVNHTAVASDATHMQSDAWTQIYASSRS